VLILILNFYFRFFSRKKAGNSPGTESIKADKSKTPEPDRDRMATVKAPARSVGLSSSMLTRSPTVKQSQVPIYLKIRYEFVII
jgi:hypothetical protein